MCVVAAVVGAEDVLDTVAVGRHSVAKLRHSHAHTRTYVWIAVQIQDCLNSFTANQLPKHHVYVVHHLPLLPLSSFLCLLLHLCLVFKLKISNCLSHCDPKRISPRSPPC